MTSMELFWQAFIIMALGMTLVFLFLAIVIVGVNAAAWIIHRVEGEPQDEEEAVLPEAPPRKRVAAIAAAVHRKRADTR